MLNDRYTAFFSIKKVSVTDYLLLYQPSMYTTEQYRYFASFQIVLGTFLIVDLQSHILTRVYSGTSVELTSLLSTNVCHGTILLPQYRQDASKFAITIPGNPTN